MTYEEFINKEVLQVEREKPLPKYPIQLSPKFVDETGKISLYLATIRLERSK